jgi:hypothetical protein
MSTPNQSADFGTMLVETDMDRLVLDQLKLWLPTYLARAESERGLPNRLLARPQSGSFQNALEDDTFPEGRLPGVIVTTARSNDIAKNQNGYMGAYRCLVSGVVRGRSGQEARELASVWGGTIRRILHHQQLADFEGEIRLTGHRVTPVLDGSGDNRWLAAGQNTFTIFADHVLGGDGPLMPGGPYHDPDPSGDPDAPYDPLAEVNEVSVDIVPKEIA